MKYRNIINKMTLDEKISLLSGKDYWNTQNIERLKIPSVRFSDGPHGIRLQKGKNDNIGMYKSEKSICFPTEATVANSWDIELLHQMGKYLAIEAQEKRVDVILGPGINIKRSPLCGRNFEYFSEDPFLTAKLGSSYIEGIQEMGVGACVKHYAVNNQENRRRTINAIIDERTLREIYLYAFENIITNAKPWAVMSAYNKVNGEYCSENKYLLNLLKAKWGYKGIVVTDWGANNNRVKGLEIGNDLEMPGKRGNGKKEIKEKVLKKEIKIDLLHERIDRLIDFSFKTIKSKKEYNYNIKESLEIACQLAEKSIVLLKNNEKILPIGINRSIALIGDMAKKPRYQGAGSSTINPYKLETIYKVLEEKKISFEYAKGYARTSNRNNKKLLKEAKKIALKKDIILICVGLTEEFEAEGIDRANLKIPKNQIKLIKEISKINKNVVVVLSSGAPIEMPWINKVKAILTGYLGGETGAKAIVKTLIGENNPSGKLAETFPKRISDTPCFRYFPGNEYKVEYRESIFVGYRYYDKVNKDVLFPFGYGLSYTEFKYSKFRIDKNILEKNQKIKISFELKNVGKYKGEEIVQIYIEQKDAKIYKAKKELKEFIKVKLDVKQKKNVEIELNRQAFKYYNTQTKSWSIEEGYYNILIGKSSREICYKHEIYIKSEDKNIDLKYPDKYNNLDNNKIDKHDFESILGYKLANNKPKVKKITNENTIEQSKKTLIGRIVYIRQKIKANKLFKQGKTNQASKTIMDLQKPLKKFYEKENSENIKQKIEGFIEMANGNYIKGYKKIKKHNKNKTQKT